MKTEKLYMIKNFIIFLIFFSGCTECENNHSESNLSYRDKRDTNTVSIYDSIIKKEFFSSGQIKTEAIFLEEKIVLLKEYYKKGNIKSVSEFYRDTALFQIVYNKEGNVIYKKRTIYLFNKKAQEIDIKIGGVDYFELPAIIEIVTNPEQKLIYKEVVKYTTRDTVFNLPENLKKGKYIFYITFADINKKEKESMYISKMFSVD